MLTLLRIPLRDETWDYGLTIMDIVIRIVWIYYVLILSADDDTPFALSHPSSCCVLAFHTKPNQSKSAVCLSVLSSHVLS